MMRSRWIVALVVAVPLTSACYQYVPVDTAAPPPLGTRVAFDVNDRGRAALSERLGAGVVRLEGTVVADDSSQYVMNVWKVAQLNGDKTPWAGERLRLDRTYVGQTFVRRLSRSRTYLASGVAVAAVVLFAKSQGLLGSADTQGSDNGGPGPAQSIGFDLLRLLR